MEEVSAIIVDCAYLRLLKMPLGLLVNFGAGSFKDGVRRIVNQHHVFAPSREPICLFSVVNSNLSGFNSPPLAA